MIRELILRLKIARWKATVQCPFCGSEAIHRTGYQGGGYYNLHYKRYVETRSKITFQCMSCQNSWTKRMQPRGRGISHYEDEEAHSHYSEREE